MSAEYKVNVKVGAGDSSMVHVTIRTEKHLFIDRHTVSDLAAAVEEAHQSNDTYWFELVEGVRALLARYPELPDPTVLGLESPWRRLSDFAADEVLDRFYRKEGDKLRLSMSGDARGASLLFTAGAASISVPVSPGEASRFAVEMSALKKICDDGIQQGKSSADTAADVKAGIAVGAVITGAGKAAYDCTAAVLSDGLDVRSAAACAGDAVTVAAGFAGMVADAERRAAAAEKERIDHQRDFERCGRPIDGNKVDIDRVERGMRTG